MLRYLLILLVFSNTLWFESLVAQNGFIDSFSDGNLTTNPKWTEDTPKFTVNASNELQLDDPAGVSAEAYLVTASNVINNASWEFTVMMSFAPSGSNFCKVYLVSNSADLKQSLDGYFVQIGGQSGTIDDVSLYRQNGLTGTELIDGTDGTVATNPNVRIKVTKGINSEWELFIDTSLLFTNSISQGTAVDNSIDQSLFFGVFCDYTSTRSDQFFFDDFEVKGDRFVDTVAPRLTAISVLSKDSLLLVFDELVDITSSQNILNYSVSGSIGNPVSATIAKNDSNTVFLHFEEDFTNGIYHDLVTINVEDRNGNALTTETTSFLYFVPDKTDPLDLVINEVLFNPRTGGVDFVELYNRSSKIISLQDWVIANYDDDTISNFKTVISSQYIVFPKQYIGLTEDLSILEREYPAIRSNNFIEVSDLPSYNDDEGIVYLINEKKQLIDQVNYSDDQHFPLLRDKNGVSLERVSFDRSSEDRDNFQSAAEAVGFATPGYQNSQFFAKTKFTGTVTVDPETFSPDNDGFQDIVNINYQFEAPGYVANVDVFDRQGRLIRSLVKNELLGSKGTFSWDGITEDNTKARIGIYIIFFDVFNANGTTEAFKKTVVVGGRLN